MGCRDDSGSDYGIFPTVSTDDRQGEADSDISFEFLCLKSALAFVGDSKATYGLEGSDGRFGDDLAAKQLDPISKITLLL